jgi:hypothetical protein
MENVRLRNNSNIVKTRNLYKRDISKVRIGKILSLEILVTNSMAYETQRMTIGSYECIKCRIFVRF